MNPRQPDQSQRLLVSGDPHPVIARNLGADAPWLVICDHAGRIVPRRLTDESGLELGLPAPVFDLHVAWDIGAAGVSDRLAERLNCGVIRQAYSRLVIDCNRDPERADAIPETSDRITVPLNVGLAPADQNERIAAIHVPYHDAIADAVAAAAGRLQALILVHSFTPVMGGVARRWTTGVLHHGASPLSTAMLDRLRAEPGQVVGDNEPYAFDSIDYTAPRHALANGLDYLEIEVRQDLIADVAGQAEWAERLARLLPLAAADAGLSAPLKGS